MSETTTFPDLPAPMFVEPRLVNPDGTPGPVAPGENIESAWGNAVATSIADLYTRSIEIGSIFMWGTNTPPTSKWLICDGSAISRTTYATLFARYGTTWGVGDGSSTFALPDLTAAFPIGRRAADALFANLAGRGGSRDLILPSHDHDMAHDHAPVLSSTADVVRAFGGGDAKLYDQSENPGIAGYGPYNPGQVNVDVPPFAGRTGASGVAPANGNVPPFVVINFIIKAL